MCADVEIKLELAGGISCLFVWSLAPSWTSTRVNVNEEIFVIMFQVFVPGGLSYSCLFGSAGWERWQYQSRFWHVWVKKSWWFVSGCIFLKFHSKVLHMQPQDTWLCILLSGLPCLGPSWISCFLISSCLRVCAAHKFLSVILSSIEGKDHQHSCGLSLCHWSQFCHRNTQLNSKVSHESNNLSLQERLCHISYL